MEAKYVVRSIEEFIELMEKIGSIDSVKWFRGQYDASFRLIPSAYRELYAIMDRYGHEIKPPMKDDPCSGSNNQLSILNVDKYVLEFKNEASKYVEYPVGSKLCRRHRRG